MSADDQQRGTISCPNCGAPNPRGATYCNSCGTWLGGWTQPVDAPTVIDVSGTHPRIAEDEPHGGRAWPSRFDNWQLGGSRVYVAGGRRSCLIAVIVVALLV